MEPLRERRRRQTYREISQVATSLFAERGFENVTIAEIAAAAGVARMTVTNHFPRKEDLVLDRYPAIVEGAARAVRERTTGLTIEEAVRDEYLLALDDHEPPAFYASPHFARLMEDSPTLLAREREIYELREDALASAIAAAPDGGEGDGQGHREPDIDARLRAARLTAAHRVLTRELRRRLLRGEHPDDIHRALTAAGRSAFTGPTAP